MQNVLVGGEVQSAGQEAATVHKGNAPLQSVSWLHWTPKALPSTHPSAQPWLQSWTHIPAPPQVVPHGEPRQGGNGVVVVVVAWVVVVVVVGAGQVGPLPGVGHASQQLAQLPTVPLFAAHEAASFLILHFVTFLAFVMQHVTNPGFPQVEWAAHFLTAPLHVLGKKFGSAGARLERVFATFAAQLTYCPWFTVGGLLWSHVQSVATCCRAANVFDPSGSSVAQFADARDALASSSDTLRAAAAIDFMRDFLLAVRSSPSARLESMVNHAKT